jgi:hypothetical protein
MSMNKAISDKPSRARANGALPTPTMNALPGYVALLTAVHLGRIVPCGPDYA